MQAPIHGSFLHWAKFFPDWLTWSHRLYGARVGIFRILEVLDNFNLKPSVALGSASGDALSGVDRCVVPRGTPVSWRTAITRRDGLPAVWPTNEALSRPPAMGFPPPPDNRPPGRCGQDFNEFADTPALLTEAGFHYTTDWANDDRPYLLGPYRQDTFWLYRRNRNGTILECMWLRRVTPPVWSANIVEAFDVLHSEGAQCLQFNIASVDHRSGPSHPLSP